MNTPATKITPEDLENKLRAFQGEVQSKVNSSKNTLMTVAGGFGVVILLLMFLLGKRSGKKKSTIVEIRRV